MNVSEDSLKIAVFIDFDNIEIGVKTTLSREFDVGAVLDAVKESAPATTAACSRSTRCAWCSAT
jgi:hypothetical protein